MSDSATLTRTPASQKELEIDTLVKSIFIPPRPSVLVELQKEVQKEDSDMFKIVGIIAGDVALTASVLKAVNSPLYGLSRKIESVDQAVSFLGVTQVANLVIGLLARKAFDFNNLSLVRFWDVSAKRAYALRQLAKGIKYSDIGEAHAFGLFCDVGIPLLMQKFPNYGATLQVANSLMDRPFTDAENEAHRADHALLGSIAAKSWGLSAVASKAIRLHHDYTCFTDRALPSNVTKLVAMSVVAEYAIQKFARLNSNYEWQKGGELSLCCLGFSDCDLEDWTDLLCDGFSNGAA